jgi:hypothetical protein
MADRREITLKQALEYRLGELAEFRYRESWPRSEWVNVWISIVFGAGLFVLGGILLSKCGSDWANAIAYVGIFIVPIASLFLFGGIAIGRRLAAMSQWRDDVVILERPQVQVRSRGVERAAEFGENDKTQRWVELVVDGERRRYQHAHMTRRR